MTFYDIMRIKMAAMVIQVPMEINFWLFIFQLGMEISTTTGTKAVAIQKKLKHGKTRLS